jgi:hypothetical protein
VRRLDFPKVRRRRRGVGTRRTHSHSYARAVVSAARASTCTHKIVQNRPVGGPSLASFDRLAKRFAASTTTCRQRYQGRTLRKPFVQPIKTHEGAAADRGFSNHFGCMAGCEWVHVAARRRAACRLPRTGTYSCSYMYCLYSYGAAGRSSRSTGTRSTS